MKRERAKITCVCKVSKLYLSGPLKKQQFKWSKAKEHTIAKRQEEGKTRTESSR